MEILEFGKSDAGTVLIQPVDEHDLEFIESEISLIDGGDADFLLRAVRIRDWNKELSPWKAPAVFGKEDFGDGAADTLAEILKGCGDKDKTYYIGGYSLAGLFAIWSVYQTDVFKGAAAASPSAWFPGFTDYMRDNDIKTDMVYLSLGDKEAKARNPVMATVADRISEAYDILQYKNIKSTLEWNEGNHFRDADKRTARAFSWILGD